MIRMLLAFLLALCAAGTVCAQGSSAITGQSISQFGPFVRPVPTYTDAVVLVANTAQTQAVPSGSKWAVFSGTGNFYVLATGTAAVPGATTTNGSAPELNPTAYFLPPGTTSFSLVAGSAVVVTVAFYK